MFQIIYFVNMAAAGEGFFDASNDIEDNFSDASDSSFHSLNEDLSKVTIEDSFKVPKKEDSKKNSQCTPSSTVNFSSDTSSADDHKELHQSSTSNLLSEANNSLDDEVNGNDFVEFDICCLESVKAEDIVVEEKLKDRDATSSDEDLQVAYLILFIHSYCEFYLVDNSFLLLEESTNFLLP